MREDAEPSEPVVEAEAEAEAPTREDLDGWRLRWVFLEEGKKGDKVMKSAVVFGHCQN